MIHRQIVAARLASNLSQRELAARAGVTRSQLIRLEKGENVTLGTLQRVVDQLSCLRFQLMPAQVGEALEAFLGATARLQAALGNVTASPATPDAAERFDGGGGIGRELKARIAELDRMVDSAKTGKA